MPNKRILIVDDDPGILWFLRLAVGHLDYEVLLAENGLEGLHSAERDPPDLIITDIDMPRMDGVELAERVKADPHLLHLPIIAITGGSRSQEALKAGCCRVLRKPFDIADLELAISSVLSPGAA